MRLKSHTQQYAIIKIKRRLLKVIVSLLGLNSKCQQSAEMFLFGKLDYSLALCSVLSPLCPEGLLVQVGFRSHLFQMFFHSDIWWSRRCRQKIPYDSGCIWEDTAGRVKFWRLLFEDWTRETDCIVQKSKYNNKLFTKAHKRLWAVRRLCEADSRPDITE